MSATTPTTSSSAQRNQDNASGSLLQPLSPSTGESQAGQGQTVDFDALESRLSSFIEFYEAVGSLPSSPYLPIQKSKS